MRPMLSSLEAKVRLKMLPLKFTSVWFLIIVISYEVIGLLVHFDSLTLRAFPQISRKDQTPKA